MRWLSWFILAYLVLALQSGLGSYIAWEGVPPNLVLIAVVFMALNAPREPALLGAYFMGLMQDALTQQPLGTYALSYGLVTLLVLMSQPVVYREHPLTHVSLTLGGGAVSGLVLFTQGMIWPPRQPVMDLVICCLYTAALSPLILWPLQKAKWLFAFQPAKRSPKRA
jgi:rod shape-determining protein MreD